MTALGFIVCALIMILYDVGFWILYVPIILGVATFIIRLYLKRRTFLLRKELLFNKYGNEALVDKILGRYFWQGQTSEQLFDSLGKPQGVDQKILKTKKKEVWKYNHQGGNRFGLRITLDNDIVVGWDKK